MDFSSITKTVHELALFEKLNLAEFITDENIEYDLYEHDNWNGGIDYYRVILNIPIEYYSALKKTNSITELEKNICELFKDSMRSIESVKITEVVAQPNASKTIFTNGFIDDSRWMNGYYRLFISHLTLYKTSASHLKQCLLKYGIDSFVAHEDIEPTKEWEIEIEKALFTMDALCAIIVPKFNESKWCDQEIGIALGLQRPILLIKKGMDPYGFVGKYQALNNCDDAYKMAQKVWEAILSNNKTSVIYYSKLISLILNATNIETALNFIDLLGMCDNIDLRQLERLNSNFGQSSVLNNLVAVKRVNIIFTKYNLPTLRLVKKKQTSSIDEDLPF